MGENESKDFWTRWTMAYPRDQIQLYCLSSLCRQPWRTFFYFLLGKHPHSVSRSTSIKCYTKCPRNTAFQFIKPFKPRNLKIHNRSPALCNPCVKHNHYYLSDVNLKLTILIKQPRSHSSANIRNKFKESETYLTESKSVDSITSNDES